jgi:hypothetical protein
MSINVKKIIPNDIYNYLNVNTQLQQRYGCQNNKTHTTFSTNKRELNAFSV